MTTYREFECPECEGRRYSFVGRMGANDPSTRSAECALCDGNGDLTAEQYYAYAFHALRTARGWQHKAGPSARPHYVSRSHYWLGEAKKARAGHLAEQHTGANHIGR